MSVGTLTITKVPGEELCYTFPRFKPVPDYSKFKMPPKARPRIEKGEAAVAERIKKSILKSLETRGGYAQEKNQEVSGCQFGEYLCECTDGYRGLLVKGSGGGECKYKFEYFTAKPTNAALFTDPILHLAVQRLQKGVGGPCLQIKGMGDLGFVLRDEKIGEAEGWEKVGGKASAHLEMNFTYEYFLDCLGSWPLMMYFFEPTGYVRIEPPSASWAYILMPYAGEGTGRRY